MVSFSTICGLIYLEWESERRLVLDGKKFVITLQKAYLMTREQVSKLKFLRLALGSDIEVNRRLRGGYRNDEISEMYYNPTYGFEFMILKNGTLLYRYDKWYDDYERFLEAIKDVRIKYSSEVEE